MKITYIRLEKFKRFPLRDLDVFEHNFTTPLTFIVGPNGAGKSSLLYELSPLPSDKNNFYKGGYKEIHIYHKNNHFKLISDFKETPKYAFFLNDENLNPSGLITTQKELVEKYFGLSDTIQYLLTGLSNFTDLTLTERKKLFNKITHIDIDFILSKFNQLKEELNNNTYLLKNQTLLYQKEEQKLLDEEKLKTKLKHRDVIKTAIDILFSLRVELLKFKSHLTEETLYQFKEKVDQYQVLITRYYSLLTAIPQYHTPHLKQNVEIQLASIQKELELLYNQLQAIEQKIKILESNKNTNINKVKKELETLEKEIIRYQDQIKLLSLEDDIETLSNAIYTLESNLLDILNQIPTNENRYYSKETYYKLTEEKTNHTTKLNSLLQKEVLLEKEINHAKDHQNLIQCPKCSYQWNPKVNPEELANKEKTLKQITEEKAKLQEAIKTIDKKLEQLTEYFNLYKQYSNIRNVTHSAITKFWSIVDTSELIFTNPKQIIQLIRQLNNELIYLKEYKKLKESIKQHKQTIEDIESVGNNSIIDLKAQYKEIETKIHILQNEKLNLQNQMKTIELSEKLYTYIDKFNKDLIELKNQTNEYLRSSIVDSVINQIDNELSKLKITLIEIEKDIATNDNIKEILKQYDKNIEETKENISLLEDILNELSPKNGIIAKTISRFINVIIDNINKIVASLWDYDMRIKLIDIGEEALNYRFKVVVQDNFTIDDISKISSGMKEIINLSFRLVLYKLLKLDNYPIYLDEFGMRLDKSHRDKINDFIFKLLNSSYENIFIITHNNINYEVFKEYDVIEL